MCFAFLLFSDLFSLFILVLTKNGYALIFLFNKHLLKAKCVQNIISDAEER